MLGYVTIGTNNFDEALQFYDALVAEIDVDRVYANVAPCLLNRVLKHAHQ